MIFMPEEWYLLKVSDQTIYGPTRLEDLAQWATEAKISPMDKVSNDERRSWKRAPMVPELNMDWLVELEDGYLYGPTTMGTLEEFYRSGEIDEGVTVINCLEGRETTVGEIGLHKAVPPRLRPSETQAFAAMEENHAGGTTESLQEKVLRLEKVILNQRLEIQSLEGKLAKLRKLYTDDTGQVPRV
jgi:hypothetical protein